MSRTRKKSLIGLLILVTTLGIGGLISGLSPEAPLLTRRSAQLASLPSRDASYEWVTDNKFVILDSLLPRQLSQIDTRTGKRIALAQLQRRVRELTYFNDLSISPDGNRALWVGMDGYNHRVTSAALDGSSIIKRGPKSGQALHNASNLISLPNSRQWVQLLAGDQGLDAVVEGLDSPGIIRRVPIGHPTGTTTGFNLSRARLLGPTLSGSILATADSFPYIRGPGPNRKIDFYEFSVNSDNARLRQYAVSLPKAGNLYEGDTMLSLGEQVILSPRGDRLAWMVRVIEQPNLLSWLGRWIPALRKPSHPRMELRISKLDGSYMKVIGYLHLDSELGRTVEYDPYHLRWLPNGQSLSFICNGAVWITLAK